MRLEAAASKSLAKDRQREKGAPKDFLREGRLSAKASLSSVRAGPTMAAAIGNSLGSSSSARLAVHKREYLDAARSPQRSLLVHIVGLDVLLG
ncbi:MAG: hypothetical protein ACK53L_03245, partial [Pirellulaceae bacterium]